MEYTKEPVDKTSHFEIVNNPDIKEFLKNCQYMTVPTGEEAEEVGSLFVPHSVYTGELPDNIISIDGSNHESCIDEKLPFTRIGYVKICNILIKRNSFKELGKSQFIDPFKVAEIVKSNTSTVFALPSSNMKYKGEQSVRDGFRLALDDYLYRYRTTPNNHKTSLRSTLFKIASYRTGINQVESTDELILHACPNLDCKKEYLSVWDIEEAQQCPSCGKSIYPSDCLRIWEEVEDTFSNQSALTRFTNVIEHLFAIHYIRTIVEASSESYVDTLANLCFFMDGPLAIYGNSAWVHKSIMKYLAELNNVMSSHGKGNILILGLVKNGVINDYFKLIEQKIPINSVFCISDEIRDKYINFNRSSSATTFGNETYYGQDFVYKTATGRLFVINIPYPFSTKSSDNNFKTEKSKLENYKSLSLYLKLIDEFECDLYENAVVPVALARKHTAINLKPGSQVLDLLIKNNL